MSRQLNRFSTIGRLVAILIFAFIITPSSGFGESPATPGAPLTAEREQFLQNQIKQNPAAGSARISYANFLINQERLADAETQINAIPASSNEATQAQAYKKHIEKLKLAITPEEKAAEKKRFGLELLDGISADLKKVTSTVQQTIPAQTIEQWQKEADAEKAAIDAKYQVSSYPLNFDSNPDIFQRQNLITQYIQANQQADAERLLKESISKYPNNERLHLTWIQWLIDQSRWNEALSENDRALKQFPQQPQLLLNRDRLPELIACVGKPCAIEKKLALSQASAHIASLQSAKALAAMRVKAESKSK